MKQNLKPAIFLLLLSICHLLQGQSKTENWQKGDVALKTNLVDYVYPMFNGSVEIGLNENRSVDLMFGYFPELNRESLEGAFNSMKGGGISSHLMLRHYEPSIDNGFFWSFGVMYKQWTYTNKAVYDEIIQVMYQDRQAYVPGIKFTAGIQTPLFNNKAVLEVFGGAVAKVRFDNIQNHTKLNFGNALAVNGYSSEVLFVPGAVFGLSVGPVFRGRK